MHYTTITLEEMKAALGLEFTEATGFVAYEHVFDKVLLEEPKIIIRVYTSISKNTSTGLKKGDDAIRVFAFDLTNRKGWIRTTRVLRVEGWRTNLYRALVRTENQAKDRINKLNRAQNVHIVVGHPLVNRMFEKEEKQHKLNLSTRKIGTKELVNFLWTKSDNAFVTESSNLEANEQNRSKDLCPKCDHVYSMKDLVKAHYTNDEDRELTHWEFKCPYCKSTLIVFND